MANKAHAPTTMAAPGEDRYRSQLRGRARLDEGGRLPIPADFRRALGVKPGDSVLLRLEDGELRVYTLASAVATVQEWAAGLFPAERILSQELIDERHAEAADE